jgi:hypothetical protein
MSKIKKEEPTKDEIKNILSALNTIKSAERLAELIEIPGTPDVGLKIAESIIEYRIKNRLFTNLMQVRDVPQIGPKRFNYIIESLRSYTPPYEISSTDIQSIGFVGNIRTPVLNYEIPSPSSYEGRSYIEIGVDETKVIFKQTDNNNLTIPDYLHMNKEYISEYLSNTSKEELEKQLYIVFDLDATVSEELEVHNATYNFKDGTLNGWSTNKGKIQESKEGHNKVAFIEGGVAWHHITNFFPEKSSGTIEFWVYFTNQATKEWYNQINLRHEGNVAGTLYVKGGELRYYYGVSGKSVQILPTCLEKWIHLNITWNENKVEFQPLAGRKVATKFFKGITKVDHIRFVCSHHQQMWIDAVGFSWDPDYNIRDNLSKSTVIVKKGEIDPEIIDALATLDETSLKAKYEIFRYLVQSATASAEDKRIPVFSKSMGGRIKLRWISKSQVTEKSRIYFIETYKLTNFPGDYGPGRLLKTFSLLPGEETEITVKTWKKSVTSSKEASSILDSYTEEKADEFERNLQAESSQSSKIEQSDTFSVNASAKLTMSVVSADVGVKHEKSMKSNRENFAKNVSNSLSKHSQKASSKREVNIETSYEKTEEEGKEIVIVRKVENLNVSRTLNFIFQQMNQQHHSLLHLTDVKLAFFSGIPGTMKEYELNELDDLVQDNIDTDNQETAYNYLYAKVISEYGDGAILDYLGSPRSLIKEVIIPEDAQSATDITHQYLRVITPEEGNTSSYEMREGDIRIVEGIIIRTNKITMRTDGVTVEALMGESTALDNYALESRREVIKKDMLDNTVLQAEVDKVQVGVEIIKNLIEGGQLDKAVNAYKEIFGMQEGLKSITDIIGYRTAELEKKLIE